MARERDRRLDAHVDARAPRHVVQHDRQLDGVGNLREVVEQPALRRLHVVRRHDERRVRAEELRLLRRGDRRLRADRARADDDRHHAAHLLARRRHHLAALLGAEHRRLARRSQDHHAVRPLRLVPLQQLAQRRNVHRAALRHRRDQRDQRARRQRHRRHHRDAERRAAQQRRRGERPRQHGRPLEGEEQREARGDHDVFCRERERGERVVDVWCRSRADDLAQAPTRTWIESCFAPRRRRRRAA